MSTLQDIENQLASLSPGEKATLPQRWPAMYAAEWNLAPLGLFTLVDVLTQG